MIRLISAILLFILISGASSCSDPKAAKAARAARTETTRHTFSNRPVARRDSAAFYLGRMDADSLRSRASSTDLIRDELLELQARRHSIRMRVGTTASDAYVAGIRQRLSELNDTLADIIE